MKYKVGDKVHVIGKVVEFDIGTSFEDVKVELETGGTEQFTSKDLELHDDRTYEDGLEDAWELAKKIAMEKSNGGFDSYEIVDIFGLNDMDAIFMSYTPQEALAKLKAYEEAQEIKVGDVVFNDDTMEEGVVTYIEDGEVFMLYSDGSCGNTNGNLTKTGKHIDIESLLGQIRSE